MLVAEPQNAAILTTFQCTAACEECCFECSPHNKKTLLLEDIKNFINQVAVIRTINFVVWTGGECFLLGKRLNEGIKYAAERGLVSRCVTNGYWATTIFKAKERLIPLVQSGLTELNLSTGDDHQEFIPVENVLNATIAALELGLTVAIAIETNKTRRYTVDDFLGHPLYLEHIKEREFKSKLIISPSVWVSFHKGNKYEHYDNIKEINEKGCEGIFETIALIPGNSVIGCCGLTACHISEMNLGKLTSDNICQLFSEHCQDFLKIWLFVEGPYKILQKVKEWDNDLYIPDFHHKCLACAYIYQNEEIKKNILMNYKEVFQDVIERYQARLALKKATNDIELLLNNQSN